MLGPFEQLEVDAAKNAAEEAFAELREAHAVLVDRMKKSAGLLPAQYRDELARWNKAHRDLAVKLRWKGALAASRSPEPKARRGGSRAETARAPAPALGRKGAGLSRPL